MDSAIYGGVGAKEVIVFQTKIMMGTQFGRIVWARDHKTEPLSNRQNEILIACLRMGWNDAFRHTSENEKGVNDEKNGTTTLKGAISNYVKKNKYKTSAFKLFRGKIKEEVIHADFDDYFSDIISKGDFLEVFKNYAKATTDKHSVIDAKWKDIATCFFGVKKLYGSKKLSFGHIQKMFNIAIKLYLCIYICREELGLTDDIFIKDIVDNFANADCPIDSIILGELEQIEMGKAGAGSPYTSVYGEYTWSQLDSKDYTDIQDKVKAECKGKSNLWFDFNNWN